MADPIDSTVQNPPSSKSSGGFSDFLRQSGLSAGEDTVAKAAADKEKATQDYSTQLKGIQKKEDMLSPPQLDKLPEKPNVQQRDPLQAFGSAASWLAVFGGLLTKRPLQASLNSAAGVMQAWKQQDQQAAQQAFEEWKVNTDNAIKLHEFQRDNYQDSLKKLETNRAGALAELKAKASAFDDKVMLLQLQHGDVQSAIQLMDARARIAESINKDKPALEQLHQRMVALDDLRKARASGDPAQIQNAEQALQDVNSAFSPAVTSTIIREQGQTDRAKVKDDETTRHNKALEDINNKRFSSQDEQNKARQQEVDRHNRAVEEINAGRVAETSRHNEATESVGNRRESESERHHKESEQAQQTKQSKVDDVKSALADLDSSINMAANATSPVTGLGGRAARAWESLTTLFSDSSTPASDFASMIDVVKTEVPKLITSGSRTSADERARIDTIIRGMSPGDTRAKTLSSLVQIKDILSRRYGMQSERGEAPVSSAVWSDKIKGWVVRDPNSPSGWSKVDK